MYNFIIFIFIELNIYYCIYNKIIVSIKYLKITPKKYNFTKYNSNRKDIPYCIYLYII